MIKLRNITKYYSTGFVKTFVLRDIDLEVKEGDFLTIMGPSGAGKSTLLHILETLDRPDAGELNYSGTDVLRLDDAQLARVSNKTIGFVFQFHYLLEDFTALENVLIPETLAEHRERLRGAGFGLVASAQSA